MDGDPEGEGEGEGAGGVLGVPHGLWLGWICFLFLVVGASPAHFWLDSGEIAAAGAELGVMHPTGAPGYVPLLHLATALPFGSLGFRMALCSSACMAGALALTISILARRRVHWALLWVIGLWLPLGLTFVRHGRVVEIYAFAGLLVMATLWGFDPAVGQARRVSRRCVGVLAAVVAAWGFGDLRLALAPAVALAWVLDWRRGEPWARWAPLCVALGSAVVVSLPLAATRGPMTDWGHPESLAAIWDHVQATAIRESFAVKLHGMGLRAYALHARASLGRLLEDLGPFGVLIALAAVSFGLSRPLSALARARATKDPEAKLSRFVDDDHRLMRWLGWIAAVELVYAVAINPMGGRDRQTGLALGLVAAVALGLGVHRWLIRDGRARLGARGWVALPLLACALWIPAGLVSASDIALTRSWAPHEWTHEVLARTPQGALLLSQSDDLSAGLLAARIIEGARPDVIAQPAQHLYREPTPWQLREPRRARILRAARGADPARGDAGRLVAVFEAWEGPLAIESPATMVLGGLAVPSRDGWGEPPLWVGELPPPRDALPPGARLPSQGSGRAGELPPELRAAVERWHGRLEARGDRRRLADAMCLWIQGRFAFAPDSPLRWLEAEAGYRFVLDEVDAEHPRALIGLAAARDRFGATDEAIALTRRVLEFDPERSTALTNLALYLSREPASLGEARELAELAVELDADKRVAWNRLIQICQAQGDQACVTRAEAGASAGAS
ncbi:DUF2723 domain-containing protein [Pseudenhygromyxa sp. WMMC2535]|uniref:protein O-mannosyl-transferase family n=1 Tax=Pseudenhygromyxa sp. WMMC2535 TaxID=2712867 RepID=UPI001556771A|nr:DUF2723 domain-containing protein [Pseudenhygromyxa sp. WMMC2535]NVB39170.1 DUF2723 domain-containing protein [Pseudenhygromyxa sp. WMMC2535]